MDEEKSIESLSVSLPQTDRVYRVVVEAVRKDGKQFLPSVSSFSLSEADKVDGYRLSTDWEQKTTPEQAIARVGCTKKETDSFKPYRNRELYALSVSFLIALDAVIDVIHTPVFITPPVFGRPDNPAHSSICFKPESYNEYAPYLFTKIRDHAKEQKVEVKMEEVDQLVQEYKNRNESL